jgi:hypothetical protein
LANFFEGWQALITQGYLRAPQEDLN